MRRSLKFFLLWMLPLLAGAVACRPKVADGVFVIGGEPRSVKVLHAPWDGLDDETAFSCHVEDGRLCFSFEVVDSTMTVSEDFPTERTVDDEDRVEVFFSRDSLMSSYWCAEIDPYARPMDYAAHFGQPFDYGWNFSTLDCEAALTPVGYRVAASVALSELQELGIDTKAFWMGVFRADFHPDATVNWYSLVPTDDTSAYFHKPDVLFPVSVVE